MTSIAILVPTMGRPNICGIMLDSLIKTASKLDSIFVYLGLTEGDECKPQYVDLVKRYKEKMQIDLYEFHDWTLPMCHNVLSEIAIKHDLHFGVGDDQIFATPGWDQALIDSYDGLANKIHMWSLLDNRDPEGMPAPIMSKEYIQAMGWRVPPYFMHWYCDTWSTEIAKANGIMTHLKDYLLIHDKGPEKGIEDATFSRIRQRAGMDRDAWVDQKCHHFLDVEIARLKDKIDDYFL